MSEGAWQHSLVRVHRHLNPLLPKQFLVHARDHALRVGASGRGGVTRRGAVGFNYQVPGSMFVFGVESDAAWGQIFSMLSA
jgi:hypothetical protein